MPIEQTPDGKMRATGGARRSGSSGLEARRSHSVTAPGVAACAMVTARGLAANASTRIDARMGAWTGARRKVAKYDIGSRLAPPDPPDERCNAHA